MADPGAWGVDPGYFDAAGAWHEAPAATVAALLDAMGAGEGGPPDDGPLVVEEGAGEPGPGGGWALRLEDGSGVEGTGALPALPAGYHELTTDGGTRRLVVAPARCHLPPGLRAWGWAAQLYAARSRESWGVGDLADLRRLATWSAGRGAGCVLVSPLHAPLPAGHRQPSPYFPSSRCFRDPLYLRVEEVPGAADLDGADRAGLEAAATAGRALNADRRIDRDAAWALKLGVLERLWAHFAERAPAAERAAFDAYRSCGGPTLEGYATFCALAEHHRAPWPTWPAGHRRPGAPGVASFRRDNADRVAFHAWLQWLVDAQLEAAGRPLGLIADLAVGVDPDGADAWLWQEVFVRGVRVGAPPDSFNTQGQDWGLPPFDPWKLRSAGYEPLAQALRAGLRHAGGLRVDHVMGLFRLFWVPPGAGPTEGAYVRYPWRDLLGVLALESRRAGAYVVGEDLGTVEDQVREELGRRDVLTYRVLWFEPEPPARWPERALASVTTHDLPTVAGLWDGSDLEEQRRLGLSPNEEATAELRSRLRDSTGAADDAPAAEVVVRAHALLAEAPSALVTATLEDALAVPERPNAPGTTDERPNWSLALPLPLEDLEADPLVAAVADAMAPGRRPFP